VNLFEAAELTAIHQSQTNLFWFNDINTNDILHVGEVLYTPPLVNDTTFLLWSMLHLHHITLVMSTLQIQLIIYL